MIALIKKYRTNKELTQSPYNFKYSEEYGVYKCTVKKQKMRVKKLIEKGYTIPDRYTEWRTGIINRNTQLTDNEDFYHYLKNKHRRLKTYCKALETILTPIEIGIMTAIIAQYITKGGGLLEIILVSIFLIVFLSSEMLNSNREIEFIDDVIEVLCKKNISIIRTNCFNLRKVLLELPILIKK